MTKTVKSNADDQPRKTLRLPLWMGIALAGVLAVAVIVLHLLVISIMERRWEAQRPLLTVSPVKPLEPDSAVWGQNYPRQYDSYLRTRMTGDVTKFGGSGQRDYLEMYPAQVILFAGYAFSKGYSEPRGHAYSVEDVTTTPRLARPFQPATCWTCKSSDVPRLMEQMGPQEFYAGNFHDLADEMENPIGCADCHDSKTMRLRISRPALVEAFAAQGRDITTATHQELRSLVCAQCHVEY
jgi:nitrite reductase (cytochrome c-552)